MDFSRYSRPEDSRSVERERGLRVKRPRQTEKERKKVRKKERHRRKKLKEGANGKINAWERRARFATK